jgi:CheY-like chemotaxis protein
VPAADAAQGERKRIVLVEDNPADVYLIQQELERLSGVELVHYGNGDDALRALQPPPGADFHRPDLVFLDLRLPGIAGHEILRALRAEPRMKDVPIVIISGASPAQLSRDDLAGADLFVHKSLDLDGYLANIRHAILTLARARD